MQFDGLGTEPGPANDPNGNLIKSIIEPAVESLWQDIIEDPGTVTITYRYKTIDGLANGTATSVVGGKPTAGVINLDPTVNWWFDSTPLDNSEYDMVQRLFRDLTGSQPTDWYNGAPPEVLESSHRGIANASAPAEAATAFDIFSSLVHEVGHVLGLSHDQMAKPETVGEGDFDFDVNTNFVRGATMAIRTSGTDPTDVNDWAHIAAQSLMCNGCADQGLRRLPSATDVFAIASAAGWTQIDLPRQDFVAAGSNNYWIAADWMGNRVPDTDDDAFIRSQVFNPTVELVGPAFARNLFVGEGDNLRTYNFKLDIIDTVTIDGASTDVFADSGGEIEAQKIVVQYGAILNVNGLVDANILNVDAGSSLSGFGSGGTVAIGQSLVNDGTINASGGTLLIGGVGTNWDLDGLNGHGTLNATGGDLVFQMSSPLADDFNGTIVVGQGHWFASQQPFHLASGAWIQLNGGTTAGNEANLNVALSLESPAATINVNGLAKNHYDFNMLTGSVNLAAGAILELLGETVVSGGTFNVATSGARVRFQANTQLSGGSFSTTGTGAVELNGATDYAGGTLNVVGVVHQDGNPTVSAPTTINGKGSWDLDGNGGVTVWNVNDDLTINAARVENASNHTFGGRINLNGSGTTMTVNTSTAWTMDGRLDIDDGAVLAGSAQMNVTGTINAESCRITAPAAFKSSASVAVSAGDVLQLDGTTYYEGGAYRGATIQQDGTANVTASTTLGTNLYVMPPVAGLPPTTYWLEEFDWDGSVGGSAVTNISSGVTFTINAVQIEGNPSTDGHDGTLNINGGTLLVNSGIRTAPPLPPNAAGVPIISPTPWRLDGTMNLQQVGGNTAVVASQYASPLQIYGTVNALGGNATIAGMPVLLAPSGQINVASGANLSMGLVAQGTIDIHAGGLLRLSSASTLQSSAHMIVDGTAELTSSSTFQGGTYEGDGLLRQLGSANFTQSTQLDVNTEFAAAGTNAIAAARELVLGKDTLIAAGATFGGDGSLRNLPASTLTLADGAEIGVPLTNEGRLALGDSPGSATVDEFSQAASGLLEIELGGVASNAFDMLVAVGAAHLGGSLDVTLINDFMPLVGHTFQILQAGSGVNGIFAVESLPVAVAGMLIDWQVNYNANNVMLEVLAISPAGIPGDYNNDGKVDAADYVVWRKYEGTTSALANDPLGGTIGQAQYDQWTAHFGQAAGSGAAASNSSVPEPSTVALALFAAGCFTIPHRRVAVKNRC